MFPNVNLRFEHVYTPHKHLSIPLPPNLKSLEIALLQAAALHPLPSDESTARTVQSSSVQSSWQPFRHAPVRT